MLRNVVDVKERPVVRRPTREEKTLMSSINKYVPRVQKLSHCLYMTLRTSKETLQHDEVMMAHHAIRDTLSRPGEWMMTSATRRHCDETVIELEYVLTELILALRQREKRNTLVARDFLAGRAADDAALAGPKTTRAESKTAARKRPVQGRVLPFGASKRLEPPGDAM